MDSGKILEIAHRTAWKYKHSSDPHHSDTYTFNAHTMIDFARKVSEREAPCLNFCEQQAFKIEIRKLKAAIRETIEDNLHLADGENCTLIKLKRAIGYT
jgi:hypothetical protein